MKPSPLLINLLQHIRGHDGFRELIAAVERPRIRPFVKSKAADIERSRAEWIYESGQMAQHEAWLRFLSGTEPQDGELQENS